MAYNVFVSYSTKNLPIAEWTKSTLHQPGHVEIFVAEFSVEPSQPLNEEIEKAIRNCDLFVLLWSSEARKSDYVPQEIGIARGCNKTILPVVMQEGVPGAGIHQQPQVSGRAQGLDGSFTWLTQFIRDNASKLAQARVFGALATALFGGIMLFAQDDEDSGDEEEDDDDYDDDDEEED